MACFLGSTWENHVQYVVVKSMLADMCWKLLGSFFQLFHQLPMLHILPYFKRKVTCNRILFSPSVDRCKIIPDKMLLALPGPSMLAPALLFSIIYPMFYSWTLSQNLSSLAYCYSNMSLMCVINGISKKYMICHVYTKENEQSPFLLIFYV